MSNTLAISAVTEALSALLRTVKDESTLDPTLVTQDPPDRARTPQRNGHQLNLFLYMVSPNPGWTNDDLPFRDGSGQVVSQPTLALDLHYMLTAYGAGDSEVDAQHVLAAAMSLVHDNGFIPRETIRAVVTAANSTVAGADLADQIELVRVCPERLSDEDLYRLWSMFQAKYRLSVGYMATVALVERRRQFRKAPPVTRAGGTGVTLRPPVIEDVTPQPVRTNETLVLAGRNLRADAVTVRINGADVAPGNVNVVDDDEVQVTLPSGLRAGPNVVQVMHGRTLNVIDQGRNAFESAPVAFVVAPRITSLPATVARGATLTLQIDPQVTRTQRVVLLLGTTAIERQPDPPAQTAPTASVAFKIPNALPTSTGYLVRVEVDGVESKLDQDATPGPNFGKFIAPKVAVT